MRLAGQLLPPLGLAALLTSACDVEGLSSRFEQKLYRAKVARAKADLSMLATALTEFAIQHAGRYPEELEVLLQPDESGHAFLASADIPIDPWGDPYVYVPPESPIPYQAIKRGDEVPGMTWQLSCLGDDGLPGGQGEGRDITWQAVLRNEF